MRRAVLIHPKGHISTHICANRLRHRLHRVQAAKKVIRLLHIWVHQQRRRENITNNLIFCSDCLIWWPSEIQRNKQLDYLFEYMTVRGNPHEFCFQNYKQGLIIASSREKKGKEIQYTVTVRIRIVRQSRVTDFLGAQIGRCHGSQTMPNNLYDQFV